MSISLRDFMRMAPRPHVFGLLLPEAQTISSWGMFMVPDRVEVITHHDLGRAGDKYVSEIQTSRGRIVVETACETVEECASARADADMRALAALFEVPSLELVQH